MVVGWIILISIIVVVVIGWIMWVVLVVTIIVTIGRDITYLQAAYIISLKIIVKVWVQWWQQLLWW